MLEQLESCHRQMSAPKAYHRRSGQCALTRESLIAPMRSHIAEERPFLTVHHPRRADSIAATSIFRICIIASGARYTAPTDESGKVSA